MEINNNKSKNNELRKKIEKDILDNIYTNIESGYIRGDRMVALIEKADDYEEHVLSFFDIFKIEGGYGLVSKSGGYGDSIIKKDEIGNIKTTGFVCKDIIKNATDYEREGIGRILFLTTINETQYLVHIIQEEKEDIIKKISSIEQEDFRLLYNKMDEICIYQEGIKESKEAKETMSAIILMILAFIFVAGLPIIAFLIDKLTK